MTVMISGYRTPTPSVTLQRTLLFLVGLALVAMAAMAQAGDNRLSFAPQSASSQGNPLANPLSSPASQDEFLPVDQAYQLDVVYTDGDSGRAADVIFQIAPEYYLYRDKLALHLHQGGEKSVLPLKLEPGETIWDDYFEKETEVYRWQLEVPVQLPASVDTGSPMHLEVRYQGCADAGLCYPPQNRYFALDLAQQTAIPTSAPGASNTGATGSGNTLKPLSGNSTGSGAGGTSLLFAAVLAFAGGVLLNLMPCVFPVLSIKALAITHNSDHRRHLHGWMYTAGVVATFVLIAALMLGLRAAGEAVGWGFQLQSPAVVAVLIYLFFAMGLSLSGVTEFGTRLMGLGAGNASAKGLGGSFATGALATVVASPCTAPFMGSALGFAVTQSPLVALAVFAALGAGMAAPFLLLTYTAAGGTPAAPGSVDGNPQAAACLPYVPHRRLAAVGTRAPDWQRRRRAGTGGRRGHCLRPVAMAAGVELDQKLRRTGLGHRRAATASAALPTVPYCAGAAERLLADLLSGCTGNRTYRRPASTGEYDGRLVYHLPRQ